MVAIYLTLHAEDRCRDRGITHAEIAEALNNPGTVYCSPDDATRTVTLGTTRAGRRLKVVSRTNDLGVIISVADRDDER